MTGTIEKRDCSHYDISGVKPVKNPEELLHDNPGSIIFARYAEECAREGDVERALDILHNGIEANPVYAPGYSLMGSLYYSQKKYKEAMKYWRQGLELDPLMPRDMYLLGKHCLENGMMAEAVNYLDIAAVFEPHNQQILGYREEAESRDMTEGDLGLAEETVTALAAITSHGMESAVMLPETTEEHGAPDTGNVPEDVLGEPGMSGIAETDSKSIDDLATTNVEDTPPETGYADTDMIFDTPKPEGLDVTETDNGTDEDELPVSIETALNEQNRADTVEGVMGVEEDLLASMDFTLDSIPEEEVIDFKALLDDFEFGMTDEDSSDDDMNKGVWNLDQETVDEEPEVPDFDDGMYEIMDIDESSHENVSANDYEYTSAENTSEAYDVISSNGADENEGDDENSEENAVVEEEVVVSNHDDDTDESVSADDTLIIIDNSTTEPQTIEELGYENLLDDIADYVNGDRFVGTDAHEHEPEVTAAKDGDVHQQHALDEDQANVYETGSRDYEAGEKDADAEADFEPEYTEPELIQDSPLESDDVLNNYNIDMSSYDIGLNETIPPAGYDPTFLYEEPEEFIIDLDEVAGNKIGEDAVEAVPAEERPDDNKQQFTETFLEDFDYDAFSRDIESLLEPFRKAENEKPEMTPDGDLDETVSLDSRQIAGDGLEEKADDDDSFYGTLSPEEISMLSEADDEIGTNESSIDEDNGIDYTDIIAESQDARVVQESMAEEFEKHVQATMASVPELEEEVSQTEIETEETQEYDSIPSPEEAQPEPEPADISDDAAGEPPLPEPSIPQHETEPDEDESLDDLLSGYVSLIEEENKTVEPDLPIMENMVDELSPEEQVIAGDTAGTPEFQDTAGDKEGEPLTATMAEIYVKQGLISRAISMYVKLTEKYPEKTQFLERLAELRTIEETRQDDDA